MNQDLLDEPRKKRKLNHEDKWNDITSLED